MFSEIRYISTAAGTASDTSSSNDLILSPHRQTFAPYELYHDTRRPPDLLPYGPQAITGQPNAMSLLEPQHRNHNQHSSCFAFENIIHDNAIGIVDTIKTTNTVINISTYASCNGSTEDLRIYHHPCNGKLATGVTSSATSSPLLSSPKTLLSLTPSTASSHNYEYAITNNGPHQRLAPLQPYHSTTNTSKHVEHIGCKPRQSIVRTSPSFSFLSTGYQQQDNFL